MIKDNVLLVENVTTELINDYQKQLIRQKTSMINELKLSEKILLEITTQNPKCLEPKMRFSIFPHCLDTLSNVASMLAPNWDVIIVFLILIFTFSLFTKMRSYISLSCSK